MIIDISSCNGKIDFEKMAANEHIERIILRTTTKNGNLDTRFMENLNGTLAKLEDNTPIDGYKFSYARSYDAAAIEAMELINTLKSAGALKFLNRIWLDLEDFGGRSHTQYEAASVLAAYALVCGYYGVDFGIYCNYNYLKNILPKWAVNYDIWLARWSGSMGKCEPFKVVLWQYTNTGECSGISGVVDISRPV